MNAPRAKWVEETFVASLIGFSPSLVARLGWTRWLFCEAQQQLHSARPPVAQGARDWRPGFERAGEQRRYARATDQGWRPALPRSEQVMQPGGWRRVTTARSQSTMSGSTRVCRRAGSHW